MKKIKQSGLVLIDKSPGYTSHHVVSYLRKLLKQSLGEEIRVGHLGTLDPFASGLLPVLIGGATKLSDEMMEGKKQYLFQITLGAETDSLDTAGQIIKTHEVPLDYEDKIKSILSNFMGEIDQVPPVYSALKMQGRPLYEYMRAEGKLPFDIETKKRKILVEKIEIVSHYTGWSVPQNSIILRVLCGKGTYVRCLARDISYAIGTVGHCSQLRRELVEPWDVSQALLYSDTSKPSFENVQNVLIESQNLLPEYPTFNVPAVSEKLFQAGNIVTLTRDILDPILFQEIYSSQKCFAQTADRTTMYFCTLTPIDESSIKLKPHKKMN